MNPGLLHWSDWFLRVFAIRFRIRQPGVDRSFARLYKQGADVILSARGFLTPKRMLLWIRATDLVIRGAKFALLGAVIVLGVPDWASLYFEEACAVAAVSVAVWSILRTPLHQPLGKLLLGKKAVIEFRSKYVRVYSNGYGLTFFPKTIRRNTHLEVSSDIDDHERRSEMEILLRNPEATNERASIVYGNSFHLKLIHGGLVERVAEVHSEFDVRRFSSAIKQAEELRREFAARRMERRRQIDELPE